MEIIEKVIQVLLQNGHIVKTGNPSQRRAYKVRDSRFSPLFYLTEKQFKRLNDRGVIKKHKKGWWIVSRRGIQHLRGNTTEKQTYKHERNSI